MPKAVCRDKACLVRCAPIVEVLEIKNAMNMVGHYDKLIEPYLLMMLRDIRPFLRHDVTEMISSHHSAFKRTEQTGLITRTNRDEICPGLRIVVAGQT